MKKKVSVVILAVMILTLVVGLVACSNEPIVITFDTAGGNKISDISFEKGEAPSLDDVVPTMIGHKFKGWYFDKEYTKPYDKDNVPKESFTLYAKFEEYSLYTFTFETNGGSPVEPLKYREDRVPNLGNVRTSKLDYEFAGWYEDEALTKEYVPTPPTGDVKLYAKWVESEYATVFFETNGGERIRNLVFKKDEKPNLNKYVSGKPKHKFEGWYFDPEFTKPYNQLEAPNHSFTVYAKHRYAKDMKDFLASVKTSLREYNLDKGFNINLNSQLGFDFEQASKDQYNWNYGIVLKGNFLNENKAGNNNLEFQIVDKNNKDKVLLGLKNLDNSLIIESNNVAYKLEGFNLSSLLTYAMMTDLLPEGTNLGNLAIGQDMKVEDLVDYISLLLGFTGNSVKIDWVDSVYTLDIDFSNFLGSIVDLVQGIGIKLPEEVTTMVKNIQSENILVKLTVPENEKALFKGVNVELTLNNETNVDHNGALTSKNSLLIGSIDETFKPVLPNQVTDIYMLQHSVVSNIELKDLEGQTLASYDIEFRMEFDHSTMQEAMIEAINTKSPYPLLKNILDQKNGKIYFNVIHNCDATCKLGHAGNKEGNTGALLTIAYDPSLDAFNNNRLYLAIDLRKIVTKELFSIIPLGDVIGPILTPGDMGYLGLSLDINTIIDASKLAPLPEMPVDNPGETNPEEQQQPNVGEIVSKVITVLTTVGNSITTDQTSWNIDFASIWTSIQEVLPQESKELITGIVNGLVPNVATISGKMPTYANSSNFEEGFNGRVEFMKKNESGDKVFKAGGLLQPKATTPLMGTDAKAKMVDGKLAITTKYNLYDKEGNIVLNLAELHALKNELAKVDITYTDVYGNLIESKGVLLDIRGLDPSKMDVPQTVTFVIGRGVGDNLWDILGQVGGLVGVEALRTIGLPQILVEQEIIFSNLSNALWSQEGIANENTMFDSQTEYKKGDTFNTVYNLTRNYANGSTKTIEMKVSDSSKLTSVEANNSQIAYYAPFYLEYEYVDSSLRLPVNVKKYTASATFDFKVNVETQLKGGIKHEELNETLKLQVSNESLTKALQALADNSNGTIKFVQIPNGFKASNKLTFSEVGQYHIDIVIKGVECAVTFNVTE